MGQIVIRAIPDDILEAFKARAKRDGLAAETLARQLIMREARLMPEVRQMSYAEAVAKLDQLRAMSPRSSGSSVADLRELRDNGPDGT